MRCNKQRKGLVGGLVPIFCKVHGSLGKEILAVCDKELCGKTLKSEDLEFVVSEGFYKDKELEESELKKMLREFDNVNLVGNKAVGIALEEKLASEENVVEIAGVKHVQMFKI